MKLLRCRRPLLYALALALSLGALGVVVAPTQAEAQSPLATGLLLSRPATAPAAVRAVEPVLETAAATPLAPPPPPNPAPPLPVPAALPNPSNRVALREIGTIRIPKLGLDTPAPPTGPARPSSGPGATSCWRATAARTPPRSCGSPSWRPATRSSWRTRAARTRTT